MNVPDYFQKELKFIYPDYFAVCNPYLQRYEIRCWGTEPHALGDEKEYSRYYNNSWVRLRVCIRDDDDKDMGFKPLDQRVLLALRIAEKESENPDQMLRDVDESNRQNEMKIDRNIDQHFRDMANDIWKFCRTITIDQGGKKW